jgi:hypothetical protein
MTAAAVTIPADLAADVAAHPDRYDVDMTPHTDMPMPEVLWFVHSAGELVGVLGTARRPYAGLTMPPLGGLRIGSIDGGPRPAPGQRVLVLDTPDPHDQDSIGAVGPVTGIPDMGGGRVAVRVPRGPDWDPEAPCYATRWALLPDPAEPNRQPLPADEREVTLTHRIGPPAVDGNWFGGRPDAPLAWPDPTLPPGALSARQLATPGEIPSSVCGAPHPVAAGMLCSLPAGHVEPHRAAGLSPDVSSWTWQVTRVPTMIPGAAEPGPFDPHPDEDAEVGWATGLAIPGPGERHACVVTTATEPAHEPRHTHPGSLDCPACRATYAERDQLRQQLAEATASLTELAPTSIGAERDRYRAALHRIATSPARCMDEDCEAPRVIASEALAGDDAPDRDDVGTGEAD